MANWKEPKNDYKKEDQVVPEIFNNLAENERYLQEVKITTEQVQDADVNSTQSTTRENVGDKETVKGFFGKVRKWFADLKALAFKGTVGTADIDNSAVTSAKIASSAVTSAKIATSAVTNTKISSVSASKVTGLAKVATSGSYNDLSDKPNMGGGFNFKKYIFYAWEPPAEIEEGLYLASAIFTNAGSFANALSFGTIAYNKSLENGSYSNISSVIFDGEEMKVQMHINNYKGKLTLAIEQSDNQKGCPYKSFDADGSFLIFLYKLSDLGTLDEVEEASETKTWQTIDVWGSSGQLSDYANSLDIRVDGLKVGDQIKVTIGELVVNMNYTSDSFFYNTSNESYGWAYQGMAGYDNWYQLQWSGDAVGGSEKELSSDSSWTTEVGLLDYSTNNRMTIKVSCKKANYLTLEWTDQAQCYIQSVNLHELQVYR